MSRDLLIFLALFSLPVHALEFSRSILADNIALLELRVPGDSVLVVDSTYRNRKDSWKWATALAHFEPINGRHDSMAYQRIALNGSGLIDTICFGSMEDAQCVVPLETIDGIMDGYYDCFSNNLNSTSLNPWDLGHAIRSLAVKMGPGETWKLNRYLSVFDTSMSPTAAPIFFVKDWFYTSPWNQRDTVLFKAQWLVPDSSIPGAYRRLLTPHSRNRSLQVERRIPWNH